MNFALSNCLFSRPYTQYNHIWNLKGFAVFLSPKEVQNLFQGVLFSDFVFTSCGKTVFLASHLPAELISTMDHCAILDNDSGLQCLHIQVQKSEHLSYLRFSGHPAWKMDWEEKSQRSTSTSRVFVAVPVGLANLAPFFPWITHQRHLPTPPPSLIPSRSILWLSWSPRLLP